MSLRAFMIVLLFAVTGCQKPVTDSAVHSSGEFDPLSYRLSNMGIVRIRSTYSIASGQFKSTCSGTLLHAGDHSMSECIALSSASCFKHIPRIAEHSVEFFDTDGQQAKIFRVHDIITHPDFDAPDANLSLAHSSVDAALVKFICTLPVSVKSARIADFKQIPVNRPLLSVNLSQSSNDDESVQLERTASRIESIDFPPPKKTHSDTEKAGVFSLKNDDSTVGCNQSPGSPVFFQSGRDLLLIAHLSLPTSDCLRGHNRYTLLAPLVSWIEKSVGIGAVSYVSQSNRNSLSSQPHHTTPTPQAGQIEQAVSKSVRAEKVTPDLPLTLPRASAFIRKNSEIPVKKLVIPTQPPTPSALQGTASDAGRKRVKSPPVQLAASVEQIEQTPKTAVKPVVTPRPTPQPTPVPTAAPVTEDFAFINKPFEIQPIDDAIDIPPPVAFKQCSGKRWIANSKTLVWGTVLKLIDKPAGEILDERMKCDLPNDVAICLESDPVATGTGHFKAQLMNDLELGGCEKFVSGETVYLLNSDFISE